MPGAYNGAGRRGRARPPGSTGNGPNDLPRFSSYLNGEMGTGVNPKSETRKLGTLVIGWKEIQIVRQEPCLFVNGESVSALHQEFQIRCSVLYPIGRHEMASASMSAHPELRACW